MDRITLKGMRFEGRLGVSEEERLLPQLLEVDVEIGADLAVAAGSDVLDDTIDYGPLVLLTGRVVGGSDFRLLERLAGAVADAVLEAAPRAGDVTVRVRKLAVPLDVDMDHAEVELHRRRA
jgi:dihydroneopterin aldolase